MPTKTDEPTPVSTSQPLARVVGVPGAVLMGLGSILGTGVFVSIGVAAGIAGPTVVLAIALAAVVALCNGLSSAQLAASHPVSGGTYEYGYRYLNPRLGFVAGWMFLSAKSASAATAALGLAGYILNAASASAAWPRVPIAVSVVFVLTEIVRRGMRQSSRINAVIVTITLLALASFVVAGIPAAVAGAHEHLAGVFGGGIESLLHATALMFVAYTGYGRIATLGEEIREPERNIPKAIVVTLLLSMLLYGSIALVAVASSGADAMSNATLAAAAPLEVLARGFEVPGVAWLVAIGAVTAMLGVLLNLLLGLSRVLLAMARRGDMPRSLAVLQGTHASPRRAVVVVGAIIAALALCGSVQTTWSFSAFTVLVYYALTNLAALRLPVEARRFPRWVAALGLLSCLGLAFWVEPHIWMAGLAWIAVGLGWYQLARRSGCEA
jgi:basic amino acid/polyamine antiporter, APA family